jgi:hypothetical protein
MGVVKKLRPMRARLQNIGILREQIFSENGSTSDRFAFTFGPTSGHEGVARQGRIDDFARCFGPRDGEPGWIEQAELNQHRSLIPIDVFVGEIPIAELNDRDQRNCGGSGFLDRCLS